MKVALPVAEAAPAVAVVDVLPKREKYESMGTWSYCMPRPFSIDSAPGAHYIGNIWKTMYEF